MLTAMNHSLPRLVLLAALVAGAPLEGQSLDPRIDSIFATYDKRDSPGCAVAVQENGRSLFAKGYGMASLEHDVPITPATAFYAASVSKQFTAFAVAMLAKQGKLSLDDDVRRWIPEVPDFGKTITIRHLIHHTSGLRDYFVLLGMTGWPSDGPITEAQFLDLVSRQKSLNFDPGTRHLYSNTGYVLLSILVERVSGQSLREFADASMFRPLGMTNSHFRDDHTTLVKNRALAYSPRQNGWQMSVPGFDVVGDGGLFTTVEDLAKWADNYDVHAVGGDDVVSQVLTRGRLTTGDSIRYAFGLSHGEHGGLAAIEHGGAYGGYRAHFVRFPDQGLAVATLCNAATANSVALGHRVASVFLGDRIASSGPSSSASTSAGVPILRLSRDQLARYVGAYWDSTAEDLLRFELRDTALVIVGSSMALLPISQTTFRHSTAPITYTFSAQADGSPRLDVASPTGGTDAYRRMPPPRADTAVLREYVGDYFSDELDTTWRIDVEKGGLVVRRRALTDQTLRPVFLDAFLSPAGVLRFTRDPDGRVAGFVVGAGRVTGFRFQTRRDR